MLSSAVIRSTTIPRVKFREGYETVEVDAFLEQVAVALEQWERTKKYTGPSVGHVLESRFVPTRFREGYDQFFVDDLLDGIAETIRAAAGEN
jgi:DivIVA domain-containing protein